MTGEPAAPGFAAYWPPRLGLDNQPLPEGLPTDLEGAIRLAEYKAFGRRPDEKIPMAIETMRLLHAAAGGGYSSDAPPVINVFARRIRALVEGARSTANAMV